jgi:hypothetical protein
MENMKYFDITIFEDLKAYQHIDLIKCLLNIIGLFVSKGETVIVQRHAVNSSPDIVNTIDNKNFEEFKAHWLKQITQQ